MKSNQKLAVALVAGIAIGGAVIHGLNAQTTPPVYVVVDISDITNPEGFKAIPPRTGPETLIPFGGKYVILVLKTLPHSMELRRSGLSSLLFPAWRKRKPGRPRQLEGS